MKWNFFHQLPVLFRVFLIVSFGCNSCNTKVERNTVTYSDTDVTGIPYKKTDNISIDIYLDATTSMEGFSVNNSSKYSQFLDQLEAGGMSAWKKADIHFFKFGQKVKPVDRTQFLSAKNDLQFYREPGIFQRTYIDSVVKNTNAKRLSVLITDLFQDEGDVNTMVEKIKEKCFANNIAVGILGIKTDFKGTVFDVPGRPAYSLTTTERPFYAIVFGNNDNLQSLFDVLKTKSFVSEDKILVFSKHIIQSFTVALTKTRDSKMVNKKAAAADIHNLFDFSMKEAGKDARFDLVVNLTRRKRTADFVDKTLEIVAYKKSSLDAKTVAEDSVATNDITIENIKRTGDKLTGTLVLNNTDGPGNYTYIVYLKANELTGLQTPAWIKDFSTDAPVPNTPSASKTLNLEKLAATLLVANASISPTYVTKFYINIFKR